MTFAEIPGHESQKQLLRSIVDSGRIPHALMLSGPSGIGKTLLARAFIQYVGCTNRSGGDSCGKCPSCLQTRSFNNPDVHYVYPIVKQSSPRKSISTDWIAEWKEMLAEDPFMTPERWTDKMKAGNSQPKIYVDESADILRISTLSAFSAPYKIFLVWLPEKMNPEAANKLLKQIEEPFADTVFVMVSNDPGAILPTISSRLRDIPLQRLSEQEIAFWLADHGYDPEVAADAARLAGGNMGKALEFASNSGEHAEFAEAFRDSMRKAYARAVGDLLAMSEKYAGFGREKSVRMLEYFAGQVRENFIMNLHVPALNVMDRGEEQFGSRFSPFINTANVERIVAEIDRARNDIRRNANQKIIWFDFLLQLLALLRLKPA